MNTKQSPSSAQDSAPAALEDAERYITTNPYWREAETSAGPTGGTGGRVWGFAQRLRRRAERALGVQIVSRRSIEEKPFACYASDPALLVYRNAELVRILDDFLARMSCDASDAILHGIIDEYEKVFHAWPHKDLEGGFGFNNGLFLFALVRVVDPEVVIESGCWRGFTTYLLDAASAPTAKLYCFDINLRQLHFVSPKAEYFEEDIGKHALPIRDKRAVAFFDDHVSHLARLRLADQYGIPFMVFDDDVTFLNVHSDGWPPLPTISMLFDETVDLTHFEWVSNHRRLVANWTDADRRSVSEDRYVRYTQDELFEITGYRNSSRTTYLARR